MLRARARVLDARLRELEALHAAQWRDDRVAARITMEEIRSVENGFEIRNGVYIETLYVVKARLVPWKDPCA